MGSVIETIQCPNCKQEAFIEYYYKTGEEYANCSSCGYHRSVVIVARDKKMSELTENDWEVIELKHPYGAYKIKLYDAVAYQCGSLKDTMEFDYFIHEVSINEKIQFASVSKFVNGKIVIEVIK